MRRISCDNTSAQLVLPFPEDPQVFVNILKEKTASNISVKITENSSSMISVKKPGEFVQLRIHRIFLSADMDVINELSAFIRNTRRRTPLLRSFIKRNVGLIGKMPPRKTCVRTDGRHYDLSAIFNTLNNEYFGGRISSCITWGLSRRRRSGKRTLGSYNPHGNIIRINPVLDKKAVPSYFVEFIVYHEMLHADIGIVRKNGRRIVHSRGFRIREKLFRRFEEAMAWEKESKR